MMAAKPALGGWKQWLREKTVTFLITVLATEAIAVFTWGLHTEIQNNQNSSDIVYIRKELDDLKADQHRQDTMVVRIDERGTRAIPEIQRRQQLHDTDIDNIRKVVDNLAAKSGIVPPVIQVQLDALKEQQLRMIYALDNTYNLLNEHLRGHNILNNPPLPPFKPTKPGG